MSWVEGIGGLFDLNRRRLQVRKQPESFAAWDRELTCPHERVHPLS